MNDIFTPGGAAENVLIYDGQNHRRTEMAVELVRKLKKSGYTVYVFAGQDSAAYRDIVPCFYVRSYIPIDEKDALEVINAKTTHGKVAVVFHGLLAPGGKPLNQLLADDEITVLSVSCVPAVRGDHRYTMLWTSGLQWRRRNAPKGFVMPETPPALVKPEQTLMQWFGFAS